MTEQSLMTEVLSLSTEAFLLLRAEKVLGAFVPVWLLPLPMLFPLQVL